MSAVRFLKHAVTNGNAKARVHYSKSARPSGEDFVTVYAKDFESGDALMAIFPDLYVNNTDILTDYFEKGLVRIPESNPLYASALERANGGKA